LKKNYTLNDDFESFGEFLDFAIEQMDGRNVRGHFRDAGYMA
jgi:hypothetical protein